jgi:hypothetical protein
MPVGFQVLTGLTGSVQPVAPSWGADGFDPYNPGGVLIRWGAKIGNNFKENFAILGPFSDIYLQ